MSTRWVRLDVDYFRNPKAIAVGVSGRALHLASICWSAAQLTDGRVPADVLRTVLGDAGVKASSVERLVACDLWVPSGTGFDIKDYLEHNPSRTEVEHEREAARQRARASRQRRQLEA